jgi:hypothetical protein
MPLFVTAPVYLLYEVRGDLCVKSPTASAGVEALPMLVRAAHL